MTGKPIISYDVVNGQPEATLHYTDRWTGQLRSLHARGMHHQSFEELRNDLVARFRNLPDSDQVEVTESMKFDEPETKKGVTHGRKKRKAGRSERDSPVFQPGLDQWFAADEAEIQQLSETRQPTPIRPQNSRYSKRKRRRPRKRRRRQRHRPRKSPPPRSRRRRKNQPKKNRPTRK